jgi:protein associated with RNAse G/E
MQVGDTIEVRALKADGQAYRWWRTTVEQVEPDYMVTFSPVGNVVEGTDRGWVTSHHIRTHYWATRPYNLLEVYGDGGLTEVYIHIASPAVFGETQIVYTDHELDVVKYPGAPPFVDDEDEFAAAIVQYSYTSEFQTACWQTVAELLDLAVVWEARLSAHKIWDTDKHRKHG